MELALLLPLLLGLSGLVLSMGVGLATQALVQRATEAAARVAAVPTDFALRQYPDEAALTVAAEDAAIVLDGVTLDPLTCDRSPCGAGATIAVTVRYRWDNPAGRLFNLLRGEAAATAYDFAVTATRVRE